MNCVVQLAFSIAAALLASLLIVAFELHQQPAAMTMTIVVACGISLVPGTLARGRPAAGKSQPAPSPVTVVKACEEGEVKWFNVSKGYGFIRRHNGEEIFVHFRSIQGRNREQRTLRDGQRVSFSVVDSDKGPQAEQVKVLGGNPLGGNPLGGNPLSGIPLGGIPSDQAPSSEAVSGGPHSGGPHSGGPHSGGPHSGGPQSGGPHSGEKP